LSQNPSQSIDDKLKRAWRQQRRFYNVRGASRFVIWLIFLVVMDFLIDWGIFFQARMTARVGLLLVGMNVIVLAWVVWNEWLKFLKPFDPLIVSLEVEEQHPELASLLVSYTQLKGPTEKEPNISAELIEAARSQAVLQTQTIDFREIVDFGQIKKLLSVAVCTVLICGAVSYARQAHVRALFKRLAGIEAEYPTRTNVTEVSGDLTVRVGDSVAVTARVAGVIPEQGRIFTRPLDSGDPWKSLPLKNNADTFSRELKEIVKDLEYYVKIGDDQSELHRIKVVPAPQIVTKKVVLTYPAYMEKAAEEVDQLNVEVPEGTELRWELSCNTAIKKLLVKTDLQAGDEKGQENIEAKIGADGKSANFALKAAKGFKYTFQWTEGRSGRDFEYDDVQHSVRVVADKAPEVELVRPSSDGLATANKTIKIVARAQDDHGLSKAWLVISLNGSDESRVLVHEFNGRPSEELVFDWDLQSNIENLGPGVRIAFAIEVGDRNPTRKHVRRSATRQFTIVEVERYLQWYRGELAAQRDEIKRVRDSEVLSSTEVKQLRKQETESP
jgi:hypothetical protein